MASDFQEEFGNRLEKALREAGPEGETYEIRLKKASEKKSLSLDREVEEKLRTYKTKKIMNGRLFNFRDSCSEKEAEDIFELEGELLRISSKYLYVRCGEITRFLIRTEDVKSRLICEQEFAVGKQVHIFVEHFEGDDFILEILSPDRYSWFFSTERDKPVDKKLYRIREFLKVPGEFAQLIDHAASRETPTETELLVERSEGQSVAQWVMKRIPKEKEELYQALLHLYRRSRGGSTLEKVLFSEALNTATRLTAEMLTGRSCQLMLTEEDISEMFPGAKIEPGKHAGKRDPERALNVLFIGSDSRKVEETLRASRRVFTEISMDGVCGNSFLFGESLAYAAAEPGELVSAYTRKKELFFQDILFSSVDNMQTNSKEPDPESGLVGLLKTHRFRDFTMKDLVVDIGPAGLMCQAESVEACPRRILAAIDLIVTL